MPNLPGQKPNNDPIKRQLASCPDITSTQQLARGTLGRLPNGTIWRKNYDGTVTQIGGVGSTVTQIINTGGGSGGTPTINSATFVTVSLNADLSADRKLTGTANQIIITDGGAKGNLTLSLASAIVNYLMPAATTAGQILLSLNGTSFVAGLPMVNNDGYILTNEDGLIMVVG